MTPRRMRLLVTVLHLGAGLFVGACTDDVSSDDGPSACIGGELCVGQLVCVDGFCVPPGGSETLGDGDPGDGDPGDGDGDPGDGDGDGDGATCGNAVLETGEACDDGNDVNTDTCLDTCELASCGDGFIGPGEGCDDGNDIDDDACTNACALASCGDGLLQEPESCDDGNDLDSDACLSTCVLPSCGDGHVWAGEEDCDDANPDDQDACLNTCVDAICGDAVIWNGQETCDDGNLDDTDACASCEVAECGDGHVWAGEEACDDGNDIETDTCLSTCEDASCGDGFVGPGESCDDGNDIDDDECDNGCAPTSCGDGIVQQGETCDDQNQSNTDGCLNSCALASCGDGFLWAGMEACDDGNVNNTDACVVGCSLATCGDGFVQQGVEACDDQNNDLDDGCTSECELEVCGDGVVQQGQGEGCDDGNLNDDEAACKSDCQPAECGDGFVWQGGEGCDDGNLDDIDGCDADCEPTTVLGVALGNLHSCVSFGTGVRCWGSSATGQLGIGSMNSSLGDDPGEMPTPLTDVGDDVLTIVSHRSHSCVVTTADELRCWGNGSYGQLGYGNSTSLGDQPFELPTPPVDIGGTPVIVAVGSRHTCVVLDGGTLHCWGENFHGTLGYGHTDPLGGQPGDLPTPAVDVGGTVIKLALGDLFTCALLDTGNVKCWGYNIFGQLGYGHTNPIGDQPGEMPPPDVNLGPGVVVDIDAGVGHICARFEDGTVRCWGGNTHGYLGYGHTNRIGDGPNEMPPAVVDVGGSVHDIALGEIHTCALLVNGNVRCWGRGENGQLGYENALSVGTNPGQMPPDDVDLGGPVSMLDVGGYHNCVVMDETMEVLCWGAQFNGQLGNEMGLDVGNTPGDMPPPPVILF